MVRLGKGKQMRHHFITFIKGSERYVFIFTWENCSEIFRVFGRYASNPEYDFN